MDKQFLLGYTAAGVAFAVPWVGFAPSYHFTCNLTENGSGLCRSSSFFLASSFTRNSPGAGPSASPGSLASWSREYSAVGSTAIAGMSRSCP